MLPLTEHKPKPLLLFGGKPLICWTLDAISAYVEDIIVTTKIFPRQFDDLPLSYPQVKLVETASANMIGAFWDGFDLIRSKYVFCGSSDVVYCQTAVQKALDVVQDAGPPVVIAIKTAYEGGEKKWQWDIAAHGTLTDIRIAESRTSFERFFLICRADVLLSARELFNDASGREAGRFPQYVPLGAGWIYLIKRLLDIGVACRVLLLDDEYLHNVNRVDDLKASRAARFERIL